MLQLRERPLVIGLAAIVAGTLLISLAGLQPHEDGPRHAIALLSPPVALAATTISIIAGVLLILRAFRGGVALGIIGAPLLYLGAIGGHIWASCDPSRLTPAGLIVTGLLFGAILFIWTGPIVVAVAVGLAWADARLRARGWGRYPMLLLLVACCLAGPVFAFAEARLGVVPHAGCTV
jgi:hypothetical protein